IIELVTFEVVHEKHRIEEVEEIQPVVHREIEKTEIHQITEPIVDNEIAPIIVEEQTLPLDIRPTIIVTQEYSFETIDLLSSLRIPRSTEEENTIEVDKSHATVVMPTMIHEVEKKKIIEEIQPIIYKEVLQPVIIRKTQPIF